MERCEFPNDGNSTSQHGWHLMAINNPHTRPWYPTNSSYHTNQFEFERDIWLSPRRAKNLGSHVTNFLFIGCPLGIRPLAYAYEDYNFKVVALDGPLFTEGLDVKRRKNYSFRALKSLYDDWLIAKQSQDLIHINKLNGRIMDWQRILEKCRHCLRTGGKIELFEVSRPYNAKKASAWNEASDMLETLSRMEGHSFSNMRYIEQSLREAGFEKIVYRHVVCPVSALKGPRVSSRYLDTIFEEIHKVFQDLRAEGVYGKQWGESWDGFQQRLRQDIPGTNISFHKMMAERRVDA